MPQAPPARQGAVRILGCEVDAVTMGGAVDWCLRACRDGGRARILLTANASHLVEMRRDPALRRAAAAADFVTADGMSLVWAGRLLGQPLPERVAGIDLLSRLLGEAARHGLRVYLLGARRAVLDRLLDRLRLEHPGLAVAGCRDGYFGRDQDAEVVRGIAESRADILFVAMPSPFKDAWCEAHRDGFGVRLVIGVGGSFDVLSGLVPRAPRWMRAAGLEWAFRMLLEPRRLWRRYLVGNTRFVWLLLRDAVGRRAGTT